MKVDARQSVRDYCRGVALAPQVQTLVRGHWKRQPHGIGKVDRKFIFVEPYWRGPEDAPIALRAHHIGTETIVSDPVVYFIRAGVDHIKIGVTANIGQRFAELQTGNAVRLELIATRPGDRSVEQQVHTRFRHLRLQGEWFRAADELIMWIAEGAKL